VPLIAAIALGLALLIPPRSIAASIGSRVIFSNLAASNNLATLRAGFLEHEVGRVDWPLRKGTRAVKIKAQVGCSTA